MTFCNSCGGPVGPSDKFCPKCGTAAGTAAPTITPTGPGVPSKSGSGVKIVLIIVAVIVGFFVLAIAGLGIVGWQIARHSKVEKNGDQVKVQTPFGTVESTDNAESALKELGIEVYPGARPQKGAAVTSFGGTHTVSAPYESDDAANKVAEFYKSRFPNANVSVADGSQYNIVSTDKNSVTTINVEDRGDKTVFMISNVRK